MRTIWKFPLHDGALLSAPGAVNPISMHVQRGVPCLWAEVDTSRPEMRYLVTAVPTGAVLPADATWFVGTALLDGGEFVLHYYLTMGRN